MTTYLVAFLLSMGVCAAVTPVVLLVARRLGRFDQPNGRTVHEHPVPRLGGIGIALGFYAPIVALSVFDADVGRALYADLGRVAGLCAGGALILALGLYDDLRGAGAKQKLAVQVVVGIGMYLLGYRVDAVANPLGGVIELGALAPLVTVLWFVAVINAVNLIDGLDGLASGIALIAVVALFIIAHSGGCIVPALLCMCAAGALVGFLFFNFNPARIFMGDTGSLFLGFVLASFSLSSSLKGPTTVILIAPALVLGVPLFDTAHAMLRRRSWGRSMFAADREHIHHRLLGSGLSHRQAVLVLYGVTLLLAGSALLLRFASSPLQGMVLVAVAVGAVVLLRLTTARHQSSDEAALIAFPSAIPRPILYAYLSQLEHAECPEDVAEALARIADWCRVESLSVVDVRRDRTQLFVWRPDVGSSRWARPRTYEIPIGDPLGPELLLRIRVSAGRLLDAVKTIVPWEIVGAHARPAIERLGRPTLRPRPAAELTELPARVPGEEARGVE